MTARRPYGGLQPTTNPSVQKVTVAPSGKRISKKTRAKRTSRAKHFQECALCVFGGQRCQNMRKSDGAGIRVGRANGALDTQALTPTTVAVRLAEARKCSSKREAESRGVGASLTRSTWNGFRVYVGQVGCRARPPKREGLLHGKPCRRKDLRDRIRKCVFWSSKRPSKTISKRLKTRSKQSKKTIYPCGRYAPGGA